MNRRDFLTTTAAVSLGSIAARSLRAQTVPTSAPTTTSAPTAAPATARPDLDWHDVRDWGVEGRAFDDTLAYFDRLPGRAKGVVRDAVWNLSRSTAGMCVRFEADATELYVRYALLTPTLSLPNMAAAGVAGVDLYASLDGRWRYAATHCPSGAVVDVQLVKELPAGRRPYLIHFPLYNGLTSFEIGVPRGTTFVGTPPRTTRPIVWYGTSITQGASASRPGMAFTNLLARRLDRAICNFGFSGNGTTETSVGGFLAEIDAAAFVIDTMANTVPEVVRERVVALVTMLRTARPTTPILLLDDRAWGSGPLAPTIARYQARRREQLKLAYDYLIRAGVMNVTLTKDDPPFLGDDGEATIDGSHPTDLGMMRYADALEPVLRKVVI